MRIKKLTILSAVILLVIAFIIFRPGSYPKMTGTVVDSVTGQPIEEAVVLVEWTKTHGIGEHWTESFKVEEAVTDKDGKFTVDGLDIRSVDPPDVTVYKKGYVAWNNKYIFPTHENRTDFRWNDGYVIKLMKFQTLYSYDEHSSFIRNAIHSGMGLGNKNKFKDAIEWEETEALKERQQKSVK